MNIENEIFKRRYIDLEKINDYGFKRINNIYTYSKKISDDFRVDIEINENKIVSGKIYDLNTNEEYTNFRNYNQNGEFVNYIRDEYKKVLEDIALKCFQKRYFITEQSNRIANLIFNLYNDKSEFVWDSSPGFGIFRNPINRKWYGLLMNIDKSKIDKKVLVKLR